jgi:MFS family permease
VRTSFQVLGRVFATPSLRRVETAFLAFTAAEYGVWVAVLVLAYERGGTTMAAVIAVVQLAPAALVAPAAARLVDAWGPGRLLTTSLVLQTLALLATGAVCTLALPPGLAYAGAVLAASAVTLTRPAQATLVPRLVASESELTAANAATSIIEGIGMLAGPALAGVLIALGGPGMAVLAFAGLLAVAAAGVGRLADPPPAPGFTCDLWDRAEHDAAIGVLDMVRTNRSAVAPLVALVAQYVAVGALDVLAVVLATQRLGLGGGGAGYLQALFGTGAVAGGMGAVTLIDRRRLAAPLLLAAATWATAFAALGAAREVVVACLALALAGASRTVLDAAGRTALHRAVPPAWHGRMFGVLEGFSTAGLAVGSMAAPWLVAAAGAPAAFAAVAGGLLASGLVAAALMSGARVEPERQGKLAALGQ